MIRAWLIRHGESESNSGLPSTRSASIPLTELGRRQAEQVARAFADPPALIVTSPFVRARQTAAPTIERFPDTAVAEWPVQEFTYLASLHGRSTTADERAPYVRAYWDRSDPRQADDGAESFADLLGRSTDLLGRLQAQESGPVAVFTHGIFMRAVVWSLLTGITSPTSADMQAFRGFARTYIVPNGGVAELRRARQDGPVVLSAATIHLPR